jgi:hypothetical protein
MKDKVTKYKAKKALSKSKSSSTKKATSTSRNRVEQAPAPAPSPAAAPAPAGASDASPGSNQKSGQPSGPILQKGWIKFFKFSTRYGTVLPNSFTINTQFYEQKKYFPNADLKKKVDGVYEFIRDNKFFFLHLFENKLSINSSLFNKNRKVIDSVAIHDIKEIYEDRKEDKTNGILEFGKFNEGYCLKISTQPTIYIICTESAEEKNALFNKLRALKIQDQHDSGLFKMVLGKNDKDIRQQTISDLMGNKLSEKKNGAPVDGYWITLQDWSQCSKKCDGGTSTYHRMCIPPKQGGKPCEGNGILIKPCNQQACPKVGVTDFQHKNNTEVLKPIVKIMPFTNHPQRYTLCKIKESDMMLYEDGTDPVKMNDPLFKGKEISSIGGIKIPSRIVMNTKTLSIFAGEAFENLYMTFVLEKTTFNRLKNKKNCFRLQETPTKYASICPFSCESSPKETEEWENDFFTFKNKCKRVNPFALDLELQKKIDKKMEEAKKLAIDEANEEKKKKRLESANDTGAIVKETQGVALKAIQKEANIEEMIKQEADERNKNEEMKLKLMIESEKKKQNCVAKAIKEKELENQLQEKAKEINDTVAAIKSEAAAQVLIKRRNLKKMIDQLNKKAELRRNKLKQELMSVRMSIASQLGNAYRKGDVSRCMRGVSDPKAKRDYCIADFKDDYAQFNYCNDSEDFCETCCQHEFGDMLNQEKENCLKKVCPTQKALEKKEGKICTTENSREISNDQNKGFIKQDSIPV